MKNNEEEESREGKKAKNKTEKSLISTEEKKLRSEERTVHQPRHCDSKLRGKPRDKRQVKRKTRGTIKNK